MEELEDPFLTASESFSSDGSDRSSEEEENQLSQSIESKSSKDNQFESTFALDDIGSDDKIFIFDLPKRVISNNSKIGDKISFSDSTLTIGNTKYHAEQVQTTLGLTCVFQNNHVEKNYEAVTIEPMAMAYVTRTKKRTDDDVDEIDESENSAKAVTDASLSSPPRVTKDSSKAPRRLNEHELMRKARNRTDDRELKSERSNAGVEKKAKSSKVTKVVDAAAAAAAASADVKKTKRSCTKRKLDDANDDEETKKSKKNSKTLSKDGVEKISKAQRDKAAAETLAEIMHLVRSTCKYYDRDYDRLGDSDSSEESVNGADLRDVSVSSSSGCDELDRSFKVVDKREKLCQRTDTRDLSSDIMFDDDFNNNGVKQ